jgi:hypothetical protein
VRFKWRITILVLGIFILETYWESYCWLSQRGLQEAKVYNMHGFLYVPLDEVMQTEDLSPHYRLVMFYTPANWVDRTFLDGQGPVRCILFRLSSNLELAKG